jgi:hypothetical protein
MPLLRATGAAPPPPAAEVAPVGLAAAGGAAGAPPAAALAPAHHAKYDEDEEDDDGGRGGSAAAAPKRRVRHIVYTDTELRAAGIDPGVHRKQKLAELVAELPTDRAGLLAHPLEWPLLDDALVAAKIKPWVAAKITEVLGAPVRVIGRDREEGGFC